MNMTRRQFLRTGGMLIASGAVASTGLLTGCGAGETRKRAAKSTFTAIPGEKEILIDTVSANFEREPLLRPFGFKGGYLSELWQAVSMVSSTGAGRKIGLGTQSVLWSDSAVMEEHSESAANSLMFTLTERALQMIRGERFRNPVQLQEDIFDELHEYAKTITGRSNLRETFTLNALVGVDNALWLLYCAENGITTFDGMIPESLRPALSHRHDRVAGTPLITYGVSPDEILRTAEEGYFFMKIKIGQPGTQEEMLAKDMARLSEIHNMVKDIRTPHTESGTIPYYFDANGRYETRDTMHRFLDHARAIGAFDRIALLEEPYAEDARIDVRDLDVRVVADETAHTDKHTQERFDLGYGAVALKPIAKTMSMSMKVAQLAYERDMPCFCADLTVNPILIEWNKNVAARLASFPGLKGGLGLLESNGHQNYLHWDRMQEYNPVNGTPWTEVRDGMYHLSEEYYARSGGIFEPSAHYDAMFEKA